MSDVSGIPYMGPMGQGNFFAPTFSYQPQLSAGAIQSSYMPEAIQSQNVFNNLYGGGANAGFGRQTDYYSQLAANQLSGAVYSQGGSNGTYNLAPAGTFSDYNAGGAWPSRGGGGGASPYQTTPNVWDTGASPFYGGGGSNGLNSSIYGGSGINWGDVGRAAAGLQMPSQSPFDFSAGLGAGMFGGLGGAGAMPGAGQLDWTRLFSGGGAKADPSPGMSMPGGLNSPMTTPQPQQQPTDYSSLFGRGVGGTSGAPSVSETAPAPMPSAANQGAAMFGGLAGGLGGADQGPGTGIDWTHLFDGGTAKAAPQPQQPQPSGGATFDERFGATPQTAAPPATGGATFDERFDVAPKNAPAPETGTIGSGALGANATPDQLAEQARNRLAKLVDPYDRPSLEEFQRGQPAPDEITGEAGRGGMVDRPQAEENPLYPTTMEKVPLPQPRPEGADAPRPSERVRFTVEPGKEERVAGVNPRLRAAVEGGAQFLPPGYSVEVFSGVRYPSPGHPQAFHKIIDGSGRAMDVRISGPDGVITPEGNDYTGMYTLLARGVKTWAGQNDPGAVSGYGGAFATKTGSGSPDLMHFDQGGNRGSLRPDQQWGNLKPLSEAEKNAMPAYIPALGANQVPLDRPVPLGSGYSAPVPPLTDRALPTVEPYRASGMSAGWPAAPPLPAESPATQVYPGTDTLRPSADVPSSGLFPEGVPLPAPRPNAEANLSQAHSLLDTNVMDLVRKNSPSSASMVPSSIASQSLREALGNTFTGGMIRSNITPENLAQAGITRADFDKAYAQGRPSQVPRFGGSDDFASPPGASEKLPAGVQRLPNGDIVSSNYWNIPKEGTPQWNQEVYEPALSGGIMRRPETQTTGGASSYSDFRRSGDVIDRRDEQLGRDQLAVLKATPAQYYADPEQAGAAANPLSAALGLRDLPVPQGGSAAAMVRPQGIADNAGRDDLANLIDKYGPEALWAAQGQSQFPQGQTQPLGGNDVSRMPYTQQSPVPGATFPVQLYDDPRYGQAEAPPTEAPSQPFPGAQEVTQQPYQPPRFDQGNPFFNPVGGAGGGRNFDETFSSFPAEPQGPTMPPWQAAINPAYRSPELISAIEQMAQRHGVPPEAIINIAGVEGSHWNPRYQSLGSSGVFQMDPPDFTSAPGGRLGGLTFDEYQNTATPAQQVDAYSDYINNSLNKPTLDYAAGSNDPALYSALLQAMQFSPMKTEWAERLAAGDTSFPTSWNANRAATELRPTSIDAMRDAFARRIAAFPQSGTLPGGR